MSNELTREERITVMKAFVQNVGADKAAAFLVDLQDAVDGLSRNNAAYVEAYREALEKMADGDSTHC
jgi:hypothetical protein